VSQKTRTLKSVVGWTVVQVKTLVSTASSRTRASTYIALIAFVGLVVIVRAGYMLRGEYNGAKFVVAPAETAKPLPP
jgi:hypothetical protein